MSASLPPAATPFSIPKSAIPSLDADASLMGAVAKFQQTARWYHALCWLSLFIDFIGQLV